MNALRVIKLNRINFPISEGNNMLEIAILAT